jgi:hypothetical protein
MDISNLPIFQAWARNAAELACVLRHQNQVIGERDSGDLQVVRTDGRPGALKFRAEVPIDLCSGIIKWERDKRGQKPLLPG